MRNIWGPHKSHGYWLDLSQVTDDLITFRKKIFPPDFSVTRAPVENFLAFKYLNSATLKLQKAIIQNCNEELTYTCVQKKTELFK
jgi:hypothetical protein